jgi:anti-sigma regulatory factor (Ser/Thr protein kinase)
MVTRKTDEIRDFIINNVEEYQNKISTITAEKFSVSRQAVFKHINSLVKDGTLEVQGKTKDRKYKLKPILGKNFKLDLKGLEEDIVWRTNILPFLADTPDNIQKICSYGFTEMLNNAIDHSNGKTVIINIEKTLKDIQILIWDNGVGIFNKIQQELGLSDALHAILELSKGKLTTDPKRHTGEGIFFSSRIFDIFSISSGKLYFAHISNTNNIEGSDWLLENKEEAVKGTAVRMKINLDSKRTTKQVFDFYSEDYDFTKTHIPVFLAQHGNENLISRSQAKRLLTRFEKFKEIILDFQDVEIIGQAFADEIFRVFQNEHPTINLYPINANEAVLGMIHRARNVK